MDCIDIRKYASINDGYGWILIIEDCYTKFIYAIPMKNKRAECVKAALLEVLYLEGAQTSIQTDNSNEFVNATLDLIFDEFSISRIRGRPRHPQNQGQVERSNQTLIRKISKCLGNEGNKRWKEVISKITYAYNNSWHRGINTTPMKEFRGRPGVNNAPISPVIILTDTDEQNGQHEVDFDYDEPSQNSNINNLIDQDRGYKV